MRKPHLATFACTFTLAVGYVLGASRGHEAAAQGNEVAPAALDTTARLTAVRTLLSREKAAPMTAIVPVARVSPVAPRHPNGAAITLASPVIFKGASAGRPDGVYLGAGTRGATGSLDLTMTFPTTDGQRYSLDCAVAPPDMPTATTRFARTGGGAISTTSVVNGHALAAFTASGASTEVSLTMTSLNAALNPKVFACELWKVD